MTGNPPFTGEDDDDIKKKILTEEPDTHNGDWKYISSGAKRIVRHMLQPNPEKRISSYAALNSEWITQNCQFDKSIEKNENLLKNVLINLKNFRVELVNNSVFESASKGNLGLYCELLGHSRGKGSFAEGLRTV